MPTPESASAAAYGTPGGLPYAPQPAGGPGTIGFNVRFFYVGQHFGSLSK